MRYPNSVDIYRATSTVEDVYGQPQYVKQATVPAYMQPEAAYLPPQTDVRVGDRLKHGDRWYAVESGEQIYTPGGRPVPRRVKLARLPEGT